MSRDADIAVEFGSAAWQREIDVARRPSSVSEQMSQMVQISMICKIDPTHMDSF